MVKHFRFSEEIISYKQKRDEILFPLRQSVVSQDNRLLHLRFGCFVRRMMLLAHGQIRNFRKQNVRVTHLTSLLVCKMNDFVINLTEKSSSV